MRGCHRDRMRRLPAHDHRSGHPDDRARHRDHRDAVHRSHHHRRLHPDHGPDHRHQPDADHQDHGPDHRHQPDADYQDHGPDHRGRPDHRDDRQGDERRSHLREQPAWHPGSGAADAACRRDPDVRCRDS